MSDTEQPQVPVNAEENQQQSATTTSDENNNQQEQTSSTTILDNTANSNNNDTTASSNNAEQEQEAKKVEETSSTPPAASQKEEQKQTSSTTPPENESSTPAAAAATNSSEEEENPSSTTKQQDQDTSASSTALVTSPVKSEGGKNKKNNSNNQVAVKHHIPVNSSSIAAKQAARHHKQLMEDCERANRGTASALRSIDDITSKTKDFSAIRNRIENLNREEENLFVELPAKIGKTKIPRIGKNGKPLLEDNGAVAPQQPQQNHTTPARSNNNNNDDGAVSSPFKIECSPSASKKKIATAKDAGIEKLTPLPLRNVIPPPDVVSPSRFREIKEPTENKKEILREKKHQELDKMIGQKPGQKGTGKVNTFNYSTWKKPAPKVEKDYVPSCSTKRPGHWEEPEKARRKDTVAGMKFTTSPLKPKNDNTNNEDLGASGDAENYEEEQQAGEETTAAEVEVTATAE